MKFDSNDEEYVSFWLQELKDNNIILSFKRGESIVTNTPLKIDYINIKKLKTKIIEENKVHVIIPEKVYTPDFNILWNIENKLSELFIQDLFENKYKKDNRILSSFDITYLEIKPEYDIHNMTRLFRINQAILWSNYNIFVNEIGYKKLFEQTFTPKKYLLTNKTLKERKIKWKVKTLEEFIK